MGYIKNEENKSLFEENSITKDLYNKLSKICLDELMISSEAYVCMIELNLHGYKRLHRFLSKEFQNFYLEVQKDAYEKIDETLSSEYEYRSYKPENLKEHLETWTEILKKHLKEVGEIIKGIFEEEGYIPCIAQEVQKVLFRNLIKNERAIDKFNDCNWSYEIIYEHDKYLHKKIKKLEEEKHNYKI